ncbi:MULTISPECIES: DUF397 domain-containing protein [unclassified Nocardia]|uniref:DUF397 domain-containing protein n=1 Tax=unclassified Nocardia TaxID=2637762 RepID=UPI001CE3E3BB|nr:MULTISPECIES: DUF397 domain-containing protein [unclassified Nocardia]
MSSDLSSAAWFKSSYSSPSKDCVEVAFLDRNRVGVRDSKNPCGPALVLASDQWAAFVADIATGRFDQR